uniref:5'-(N(7)-methylguanosine 5'-triphospho)-[mRNA] hydrolase n=1 Tax=Callorhinchus milii TaxID=7868 RepID=A0A4W3JYW1_CALMI
MPIYLLICRSIVLDRGHFLFSFLRSYSHLLFPTFCSRSASPRHGFTIMNRLSVENRTEPITKDLDFQLQDPFLLYRNARLSIYGIWFYDKAECQRIAELMKNLTHLEQWKAQQGGGSPHYGESKAVDILQMLSKAEHEYNKVQNKVCKYYSSS